MAIFHDILLKRVMDDLIDHGFGFLSCGYCAFATIQSKFAMVRALSSGYQAGMNAVLWKAGVN